MRETVTVEFVRYRTPAGEPTCCVYFGAGVFCEYLATRQFGLIGVCTLGIDTDVARGGADGRGYMKPKSDCILWAKK